MDYGCKTVGGECRRDTTTGVGGGGEGGGVFFNCLFFDLPSKDWSVGLLYLKL